MYPAQVRLCYKSEMFNWLRTLLTDMFWKKTMVGSFFLFGMFSILSETFNKTFEERRKTTQQKQIGTQMKPSVLQKRSKCVFPVGLNIFGIFVKWCHYWHNKTIDLLNIKQLRKKQIPPSTTYRHKNPTGNELYGRNLCAVLFFSAWRGYLCIYGFLEETLGSVYTLCVCVCVRQCERERERKRASMWVTLSVCNVLSSWTLSWTLLPSEEDDSCQIWGKKKENICLFVLLFWFFSSFLSWMFALKDVMSGDPSGFWTFF